LVSSEELLKRVKAQFLKESRRMTRELRKALIGKTIKDVEVLWNSGDVYIKLVTDKGQVLIGANDLGVWIDRPESLPSPTKRKREGLSFHTAN
jgi:ribosomal protein S3